MTDRQRHGFILLLVAGLIAASVALIATKKTRLGLDLKGGVELVYKAEKTAVSPVIDPPALQRAVDVMNNRVNQLGVTQPQITTEGKNLIDVQLPDVKNVAQAEQAVGTTAQLFFYDWEANALTPEWPSGCQRPGQPAMLPSLAISQGELASPGWRQLRARRGAMGFYQAVKLASKQPLQPDLKKGQGTGDQFFLFGAPGSSACAAYAKAQGTKVQKGVHCLIAETQAPATTAYAKAVEGLKSGTVDVLRRPARRCWRSSRAGRSCRRFRPTMRHWPKFGSPDAGYYVIRDNVALTRRGDQQPGGEHRPERRAGCGVRLPGQRRQPVPERHGEDLPGARLRSRARLGSTCSSTSRSRSTTSLSASRRSTSSNSRAESRRPAAVRSPAASRPAPRRRWQRSCGSARCRSSWCRSRRARFRRRWALRRCIRAWWQALVGLAVVALFLLTFYRVLGVIAIGGLVAYGIYFFALIKLIPITMTLAGIAGLILTIGVAADANVVIFERVKEEIRAGRSVRQGIATGYRKGLTAIIDANVVTIMTAFILFVLSTSDVKGFAFTLGIGTFVSLFTAVLATQAILTTMGDSRAIQSPSALGAGGDKRHWRFDFMGASRYFFSMSGVILLVGALAIGGRGLNLGIDFTGGTQMQVGFTHRATVNEVKSLVQGVGGGGKCDRSGRKRQGARSLRLPDLLQVPGQEGKYTQLRSEFQEQIRDPQQRQNDFNTTSVGPTFGSSVTKSAVIAIIVSLLVISLYVALRFEWKFAIPVLIALMHDLLDNGGRICAHRASGDRRHGRRLPDDPWLLALRHDHRL